MRPTMPGHYTRGRLPAGHHAHAVPPPAPRRCRHRRLAPAAEPRRARAAARPAGCGAGVRPDGALRALRHLPAGEGAVRRRPLRPLQGMKFSPSPATHAGRAEDWRILSALGLYRLLLVIALLALYESGYASHFFEQ